MLELWDDPRAASIEVVGDGVGAMGDPARIRQILRNLVSNALKYGGDEIGISVTTAGDWAHMTVADNGPGIDATDRDRIFEPYERASTSDGRTDSVGLGLAVSRTLARRMGGDLVYDHRGGQSLFTLRLPPRREPGVAAQLTGAVRGRTGVE